MQALVYGQAPDGSMVALKVTADGTLQIAGGTGEGGGGDASAANQLTQIARLEAIRDRLPAALARTTMLSAVTTTQSGNPVADNGRPPSFSASVAGAGAVSATVRIEARNAASGVWFTLGTITLSGTTSAADGFASLARYMEYRAVLAAVSGTGAAVTVTMGS